MEPMFTRPDAPFRPADEALAVSEFVRHARRVLEGAFPLGWISGEVANLTRAASGHLYFTLRDSAAQVRCVMYRSRAQLLPFRLEEGLQVDVRALTTLYEPRGEFQLQVEGIRQAGRGGLFEAFLRLKERLAAEGLFDEARKRPLPPMPRGIGIVTSTAGAALHDVLVALERRAPHLPVVIYPSPVQGADAGGRLASAVAEAGARASADGIDVLLVCRGGGSLEDLWAFNDEQLVRAIVRSPIPVICGVGHETDFTLADFAADLRAATPTAAAELASAGLMLAAQRLSRHRDALRRLALRRVESAYEMLDRARLRLRHPRERLARQRDRVAALAPRLDRAAALRIERLRARCGLLGQRLGHALPDPAAKRIVVERLGQALSASFDRRLTGSQRQLDALRAQLGQLNPEAVLARGYAIVRDEQGRVVRDAAGLMPGDLIDVQTRDAQIAARIETLSAKGSKPGPQHD